VTRAEKIAYNKAERAIERAYGETCKGVEINVMDIGKVFAEGRKALAEGRDLKEAIVAFVATIRLN
jgi:hypothetical protein